MKFTATIKRFGKMGEKTGWTYLDIPSDIADSLDKGNKKSFRVKGSLGNCEIEKVAILPMGEGNFILPLNATMRKQIRKNVGDMLQLNLQKDNREIEAPSDFIECLIEEEDAYQFFKGLPKSHQNYYFKWIDSAKGSATRAKRIAQALFGFTKQMSFSEMIRYFKEKSSN